MVRINLLPPEYRAQPQIRPLRLFVLFLSVILPLALAGAALVAHLHLQSLKTEIEQIRQERAVLGDIYEQVVAMENNLSMIQNKLDAMAKVMAEHLQPVAIFASLGKVVPQNVTLNTLRVIGGGTVVLNGTATNYYGVAAFQLKLSLSSDFGAAVLNTASGEEPIIQFDLATSYRASQAGASAGNMGDFSASSSGLEASSAGQAAFSAGQAPAVAAGAAEPNGEVY